MQNKRDRFERRYLSVVWRDFGSLAKYLDDITLMVWYNRARYHILKLVMLDQKQEIGINGGYIMSLSTTRQYNLKLEAALIYILTEAGEMEIMKLAKLLYLADYLYAKTFGSKRGFMEGHVRYEFGPVPIDFYQVYDILNDSNVVRKQVNTVSLISKKHTVKLTEAELACIDKTLEEFASKRLNDVKKAAYDTEPMATVQRQEMNLGSGKLMYEKMNFELIPPHPLFASK